MFRLDYHLMTSNTTTTTTDYTSTPAKSTVNVDATIPSKANDSNVKASHHCRISGRLVSRPRKFLDKEQFGLCKICNDKATGIHYGISSCEGCKGFYKRSILRKRYYACSHFNQCVITVENRKNCKSCRYAKCVGVGMCVEGIFKSH